VLYLEFLANFSRNIKRKKAFLNYLKGFLISISASTSEMSKEQDVHNRKDKADLFCFH